MPQASETLSREQQLCVLAARLNLLPEEQRRLQDLIRQGVDWAEAARLARCFGVAPLLHRHLASLTPRPAVPDRITESLDKAYRWVALQNTRIYGCLRKTLVAMRTAEIPVILLKGVFMARWVYGDIALRPMSDIDILCRPEDSHRAADELSRLGYWLEDADPVHISPIHEKVSCMHAKHLPHLYDRQVTRVEIHSELFGRGGTDTGYLTDVWTKSSEYSWDGLTIRALSPEYQILYLCSHAHRHLSARAFTLYWLSDLHEVVERQASQMDWETFWHLADRLGVTSQVKTLLLTLNRYWNTSLPPIDQGAKAFDLAELFHFVSLPAAERASINAGSYYLGRLQLMSSIQGWKNRFDYLWQWLFPQREFMQCHYHTRNRWMLCLMYAVRPFIGVGRVISSLYRNAIYQLGKSRNRA
jgi:hypothetical protein